VPRGHHGGSLRLRDEARTNEFLAGQLLLASRGVAENPRSVAGAALEAEMMLAVVALVKSLSKR
jgi:hypothetical protein